MEIFRLCGLCCSFILVFFSVVTLNRAVQQDDCSFKQTRCGKDGPEIRFPFWVKKETSLQNNCRNPGFELACSSQGHTVLPVAVGASPVTLFVKRIDYVNRVIHVDDGQGCLPRWLPLLNLSAFPFHFLQYFDDGYHGIHNYTLFNCSSAVHTMSPGFTLNWCCFTSQGYRVYAIKSEEDLQEYPLSSCKRITGSTLFPSRASLWPYELALQWSAPNYTKCEGKKKKKKGVTGKLKTTGYILGSFLLILITSGCYYFYNVDKREKEDRAKIENFLEDYKALKLTRYSYADIKRITNQFKQKLGQGGFGAVFKGKLSDEVFVAVKILTTTKGNGEDFINEVGTISQIHHVNAVRLVGFCADGFRRALIYEFLPNKSLEKYIFSENIKKALGWKKLKDIALGIAKGIGYLHQGCDHQILHFDIKPHNILLDRNFIPKISDFGQAKLCSKDQSVVSMPAARGTLGYIAPEVFTRNFGGASHKSDVYSFGMLLLDMVEGRRNMHETKDGSSQGYFPDWIYNRLERGEVIGTGIETVSDANVAKQLTIVGLWCIQWFPVDRPPMKLVVQMLEGEGDNLTMPPNPFSSTKPMASHSTPTIVNGKLGAISE